MRINLKAMAAGLAVLVGISGAAWGSDFDHHDRDDRGRVERYDHDRGWDRDHDRRWNDHDRDDRYYRGGYNRGYYPSGGYGYYGGPRYYPNSGYYGNPGYGYYGPSGYYGTSGYYGGNASSIGYRDGINDGRNDRVTGHSFRPTHDDNFKNADRGYSSGFGSKQAYKDTYRQGYEQGYQQGYGR